MVEPQPRDRVDRPKLSDVPAAERPSRALLWGFRSKFPPLRFLDAHGGSSDSFLGRVIAGHAVDHDR
jgi:hypothetical protein